MHKPNVKRQSFQIACHHKISKQDHTPPSESHCRDCMLQLPLATRQQSEALKLPHMADANHTHYHDFLGEMQIHVGCSWRSAQVSLNSSEAEWENPTTMYNAAFGTRNSSCSRLPPASPCRVDYHEQASAASDWLLIGSSAWLSMQRHHRCSCRASGPAVANKIFI